MYKFSFLVGAGLGFVLGSKLGTGPYEQLQSMIAEVLRRPEVQGKVEQMRSTAKEQMSAAVQKASAKIPGQPGQGEDTATAPSPGLVSNSV